jgi:hypothetical protein
LRGNEEKWRNFEHNKLLQILDLLPAFFQLSLEIDDYLTDLGVLDLIAKCINLSKAFLE